MIEYHQLTFSLSRNCAFQHSAHPALLAAETDAVAIQPGDPTAAGIDVLPRILLPLAGPEEFDLEVSQRTIISSSSFLITRLGHGEATPSPANATSRQKA